jgi:polyhydroxyalkanoate synthesis regulator phasin
MGAMSRGRKLAFGAAAGAALLAVGLGTAGAVAASHLLTPSDESKAVIDDAAAQLGVEPSALSEALKRALENRIDAAVTAGRLSKDQADELKKRIESDEFPLLLGPGLDRGPGFGPGFGPGAGHDEFVVVDTAASYLGMSQAELSIALETKSLADIAKEKGKSVAGLVQALVTAQEAQIDEAVKDGHLTKQQASELKAGLQARMQALVNGDLRRPDGWGWHRFWPGARSARAPPWFAGPRA